MPPLLAPPRRRKARERPLARAIGALLASLALNGAAVLLLSRAGAFTPPRRAVPAPVALQPLGAERWRANREVRPSAPPAPRPEPPQPERGRVVELSPRQPAAETPPPNARFLSDRNTRASRETVARGDAPPGSGGPPRSPKVNPPAQSPTPSRPAPERRQARAAPSIRRDAGRDALALAPAPDGELARRRAGEVAEPGDAAPPRPAPDLSVAPGSLARIAGGGGDEHVDGVEEGEETWLEAREFRFATFLNQMRREIGEAWYPRVRATVRGRDPDGSSIFFRERTVVLAVTLGTGGEVRALSVLRSSSVDFVDEIALAAVREAQPFPNPPRAMFEDRDEVRVPFAFTIYPAERGGAVRWRAPIGR